MENETMYTRSNGEQVPLKGMNSEHIINSWSKEMREIFNSKNDQEYSQHLQKIETLKQEYYRRLNDFRSKMSEE